MDRRGFLQSLMIGASALAVDPERLLWKPNTKKIFIPSPKPWWLDDVIPGLPDKPTLLLTMSFDDGKVIHWRSETYVPAVTLRHSHLIAEATDFRFNIANIDELFKGYPVNSETHPAPRSR